MYSIKDTPQPAEIEILKLGGLPADSGLITASGWKPFSILASKLLDQEKAQYVWHLWKQLPAAEQMRCHVPPFGMRFKSRGEVFLECSICWQCNNIFILTAGNFTGYQFDASADVSLELKAVMQTYLSGTGA